MPFEVGEGFKLLLGRRVVHLAKDPGVELPSHLDRVIVANAGIAVSPLAEEGDGLGDDVIRGQQEVGEPLSAVRFEDLVHACVVLVVLADVGEEEARVQEDHSSGLP